MCFDIGVFVCRPPGGYWRPEFYSATYIENGVHNYQQCVEVSQGSQWISS